MAYITHDPPRKEGVTASATSADGLHWRLANTAIFTNGHFENTGLLKFNGLYYLSGQNIPPFDAGLPDGSPGGGLMKLFFSPDFRHWSEECALGFYRRDYQAMPTGRGQESHMGAGLWNRGNVIVGLNGRWHGDLIRQDASPHAPLAGLKIDLGLLVSNDAIHYREPVPDFVMVPHGTGDDWDSEALLQANAFANTDTETLIWYSHWNTSFSDINSGGANTILPLPAALPAKLLKKGEYVGLLTMPRGRFGYFTKLLPISKSRNPKFDAPQNASFLTQSIRLSRPNRLWANVEKVSPDASLKVELVDDAEQPLPGYVADLTSDGLKMPIRFRTASSAPINKPFRIRVIWPTQVNDARLYAVYVEAN